MFHLLFASLPGTQEKGAPVDYMLSEGAAGIIAVAVLKNAPHPNTAWLFTRWAASEEGQAVYAKGGRTPAHPKVEPTEPIRPKVDLRGRGGGSEAIYQV